MLWMSHKKNKKVNEGARSYRGEVIGDSMAITINFKWALQICVLVGVLVYGYWQIETRIKTLENEMVSASGQIRSLLDKHMEAEREERLMLEKQVGSLKKKLGKVNPFNWRGK